MTISNHLASARKRVLNAIKAAPPSYGRTVEELVQGLSMSEYDVGIVLQILEREGLVKNTHVRRFGTCADKDEIWILKRTRQIDLL